MKESNKTGISRRQFLQDASVATLGGSLLLSNRLPLSAQIEKTGAEAIDEVSNVVLVRNRDVLDGDGNARQDVALEMLDAAITRLTEKDEVGEAWAQVVRPDDVVGIKTNVWTPIGTTSAIEQSLKAQVMEAGVAEEDISIDDRGVLQDQVFQRATTLINARPMRSHHWAGVGGLIKNYITFVPDPDNYHEDACSRLGEIWSYPMVQGKTRLNVLVMFTPQFHCVGPHGFSPRHVWQYHGVLVGFDPVAVDTVGVQIIQGIRREYFGEERPMTPSAKHIAAADTQWGIGNASPEQINLVKIGYDEGSFC
jgi:hypothetical protein